MTWPRQTIRHKNAATFGKAGGPYVMPPEEKKLREAYAKRFSGFKALSPGTKVTFRDVARGSMSGTIVRFDIGDAPYGWPFYVVDVGEYESIKVPFDSVQVKEENQIIW